MLWPETTEDQYLSAYHRCSTRMSAKFKASVEANIWQIGVTTGSVHFDYSNGVRSTSVVTDTNRFHAPSSTKAIIMEHSYGGFNLLSSTTSCIHSNRCANSSCLRSAQLHGLCSRPLHLERHKTEHQEVHELQDGRRTSDLLSLPHNFEMPRDISRTAFPIERFIRVLHCLRPLQQRVLFEERHEERELEHECLVVLLVPVRL